MTNMPNAPLVYTLGVVRFPRVPEFQRFPDAFHELVRSAYPSHTATTLALMVATFGPEGLQVGSKPTSFVQFASPDKKSAFLLTEELLALHTVAYDNHQDFANKFKDGLDALLRVPGIGIQWLEAVGLRYVDLVVPRTGETLDNYLRPWILPAAVPEVPGGLTIVEGMYVATYRSSVGDLRFQVLRNPPTTLPPELDTPIIQENGWKMERPEYEFAVMDLDHGCRFDPMVAMDAEAVRAKMLELRAVAKDMFLASGTVHAFNVWNEKRQS
jgi:uncharacterized protein (TIGR04255 family)